MDHATRHPLKVVTALASEFWACGWLPILLAQFGALLPAAFLFALMKSRPDYFGPFRGTEEGALFYFTLYWTTIVCLGGALLTSFGKPRPRYTLPVSSWLLVAVPMACAAATMFVQFAIVASVENVLFDAGWPVWGPALLAAVLLAACQAILWSTSNSLGMRCVACLAAGLVLAYSIAQAAPNRRFIASGFLFEIAGRHVLELVVALLASVAVAAAGFAWLRQGSGFDFERVVDSLRTWFRLLLGNRARPFRSRRSAQFWLEWSERGYTLPLAAVLIGIPLLLLAACAPAAGTAAQMVESLAALSTLFFPPLLVIGLIWGSRSRTFEFGHFGGSRSLSDGQIAAAILKSATLGLVAFALVWACFTALLALVIGRDQPTILLRVLLRELGPFNHFAPWCLAALAIWSVVGLVTSLALAGRRAILVAFALVFAAYVVGGFLAYRFEDSPRHRIVEYYAILCLGLCLVGCLATFLASWRRDLISWPGLLLSAAIVTIAVMAAHVCHLTTDWPAWLYVLACCGLLPVPFAAAPLAVHVSRHC